MPESATIMESKNSKIFVDDQRAYQDFVRFGKFFTSRLVWALVQSRSGDKIWSSCTAETDRTDWFNVRIDELGEVTAELRRATGGRYPPQIAQLSIDFLLHTADGEQLPLETWSISYDSGDIDASVGVGTQLYHQLSTLLKSIIVASRVTPAYRYCARKQAADSFVLLYQIYEGGGKRLDLGAGHREIRLGALPCPFGSFSVDLRYRTSMVIAASLDENNRPITISPATPLIGTGAPRPVLATTITTAADHQPSSPVSDVYNTFSTSPASPAAAADHLPWYPQQTQFKLGHSGSSSEESAASLLRTKRNNSSGDDTVFRMDAAATSASPRPSSSFPERSFCRQPLRHRNNSFPFAALLSASAIHCRPIDEARPRHPQLNSSSISANMNNTSPLNNLPEEDKQDDDEDEMESSDDSFVKVPSTIFASRDDLDAEWGDFVRQCKAAPSKLHSFDESAEPKAADIRDQLAQFAANIPQFDSFVSALRLVDEPSDGEEEVEEKTEH